MKESQIKGRDIIVFSLSDWSQEMVSNRFHMITRLAKNNRVFFFERPINFLDTSRFPELFWPVRYEKNFYLVSIPDTSGPVLKKKIYENQVQQLMNYFHIREPIFWFYDYRLGFLLDTFKPKLSCYHCTEDYAYSSIIHSKKQMVEEILDQEKQFVSKVDLVFAVSEALTARHKKNNLNTVFVPNAVEYETYAAAQTEFGKKMLKNKVIGSSGNFSAKIDFQLLDYITDKLPDNKFIFIGPIAKKSSLINRIRRKKNVEFIPKQSIEKLIDCLKKIDVLIIPYIQDKWFQKISQPLRLYEYLATGKPIVSTPMDCLNKIKDLVYVGQDTGDFLKKTKSALKEQDSKIKDRRMKLAQKNTWDDRFNLIADKINKKLKSKIIKSDERVPSLSDFRLNKKVDWFFDFIDLSQNKDLILEKGKACLAHRFTVLNKTHQFKKAIDWSIAFSGLKSWAKGHFEYLNQVTYNNGFQNPLYIADVKLVWEFNKHLHFITLAECYQLTKDEKYAKEFIDEIISWLEQNPYEQNQPWTQTLIVSHRVISWVIALGAFAKSSLMTEEIWCKIFSSLENHADYIEKHYEIGEASSNHLLGNLAAQIVLCSIFPEISDSNLKIVRAMKMLEEELDKQIYPDGADYEQSLSYHRVVLEFLLLVVLLDKKKITKVSVKIKNKVKKMAQFLQYAAQPNGFYQPISDADGARVFMVNNNVLDSRPYLNLVIKIFGQGSFNPDKISKVFSDSGYCFLRKDWSNQSSWMFFDAGPISMGKNPEDLDLGTHGHSDTLNFGLALGGQTIITDIGSYAYTTERPFHHYFRSSFGHNLPIVDNEDENILSDYPWVMKQVAQGKNLRYAFSKDIDYVSAEHDGYKRLKDPLSLRREIIFNKKDDWAAIIDSFGCSSEHEVTELLHLYPGLRAKLQKEKIKINSSPNLTIRPFYDFQAEIVAGKTGPVDGWYASDFGLKVPAEVLKIKTKIKSSTKLVTLLNWGKFDIKLVQVEKILNKYRGNID